MDGEDWVWDLVKGLDSRDGGGEPSDRGTVESAA